MPTGEIEFDSIERIFAQRDAKLAKKAANTIVRYQPKTQTIDGARAVGTSYLEYSPEDDEFTRSTSSHSRTASRRKKAKNNRDKKGSKLSNHKSGTHPRTDSHARPKSATGSKQSSQRSRNAHSKNAHYQTKRLAKSKDAKSSSFEKAVIKTVGGVAVTFVGLIAALFSTPSRDAAEVNTDKFEHQPGIRIYETDNRQNDTNSYVVGTDDGKEYTLELDEEGNAVVYTNEDVITDKAVDETSSALTLEERLDEIFANDPEAKIAFDDINKTLNNITNELGEDAVSFIRKTRDTYAPNVSLPMLICIFEHESLGRMRDADGSLLLGGSGDTGIGQVTPKCEEDVNSRLNPDGRTRSKEDAHDNIEISAISLQDHCEVWGYDVRLGDDPDNLDAILYALSSYNAGDNNVRKNGIREKYVEGCFDEHLNYMIKYPEFAAYFGCEDFID